MRSCLDIYKSSVYLPKLKSPWYTNSLFFHCSSTIAHCMKGLWILSSITYTGSALRGDHLMARMNWSNDYRSKTFFNVYMGT